MKITALMVVEAALVVLLSLICTGVWFANSRDREIGQAYRQARKAMIENEPSSAIEPLERLRQLRPNEFGIAASLGGFYLRAEKYADAIEVFKKLAEAQDAPKKLRALAEVHLGMLEGSAATKSKSAEEQARRMLAAKKHFAASLKLDASSPEATADANVGLGLVALWEKSPAEAEKYFNEVVRLIEPVNSRYLLGRETAPEFYNGLGIVAGSKGNFADAEKHFKDAVAAREKWNTPDANRRLLEEDLVGAPQTDPAKRKQLLAQIEPRLKTLKEGRPELLNSMGCGYFYLGDYARAAALLDEAIKLQPERSNYWINLLTVRCRVLEEARAALTAARNVARPPKPVDPVKRLWTTPVENQGAAAAGGASEATPEMKAFRAAEANFAAAEAAFDPVAGEVLSRGNLPDDLTSTLVLVRIEMRLRAAAAKLEQAAAEKKDKAKAEQLAAEAAKTGAEADALIAEGLKKFPDDPRLTRMQGIRLLAAGKVKETIEAFNRSLAKDGSQKELQSVVEELSRPVEIVAFRPASPPGKSGPVLANSAKPLLGALFRTNNGPAPLTSDKVRLLLDGKAQGGIFWGSEFLSLPDESLADGEHVLRAEAEDALGRKASAEAKFLVDDSPPEIVSLEPADGGSVAGPRPRLVVTCKDRYAGVDPSSFDVELKSEKEAQTQLTEFPVKNGRYTFDYPEAGIKRGMPAGEDKFVFYPTRTLGPGIYTVTFTVGDQRGIKLTRTWRFTVSE